MGGRVPEGLGDFPQDPGEVRRNRHLKPARDHRKNKRILRDVFPCRKKKTEAAAHGARKHVLTGAIVRRAWGGRKGAKNTELEEEEGGIEAVVNTAGSDFLGGFDAFFMVKTKNKMAEKGQRLKRENTVRERLRVE